MIVSEKGRYVRFEVDVWLNEKDGAIHLVAHDQDVIAHVPEFHTTINNKEGSARCHRNMFGKLMKLLRATGKA